MLWLVAAAVAALVLFVLFGFQKDRGWRVNSKQWLTLLALLVAVPSVLSSIPTGHTGILTTFGRVEDKTLEAGIHFKLPYQEVAVLDNRAQINRLEMSCFSSDIQEVQVVYSINYQIKKENAQTIYKTIGTDYFETMMAPRIQETVKSVLSKYNAENLMSSRDELSKQITETLEKDLSKYNIIVIGTAVENLDFSDAFTTAVEEKQVAEQMKLKAAIEQEQKNLEAEADAKRQVIAAEAEAEVTRIQADVAKFAGEKEAEMNRKLSENMTEELIQYYMIKQWNGQLPQISGTSVFPVLEGFGDTLNKDTK